MRALREGPPPRAREPEYQAWLANHAPGRATLEAQASQSARLAWQPSIDLVVVRRSGDAAAFAATQASLESQSYQRFQMLEATTANLDEVALRGNGELIGALEAGDRLAPHALFSIAGCGAPDADLYYSDEDVLEDGVRARPFFKPGWSADALFSHDFVGGLALVRRHLFARGGGFRGASQHDLLLRLLPELHRVHHLPDVLFHRRPDASPEPLEQRRSVVRDQVARLWGSDYHVATSGEPRITYQPAASPRVAVIIPLRDKVELLRACVQSFDRAPSRAPMELVLVDNGSTEPATLDYLNELSRRPDTKVLRYPGSFNWSAINNFAAARSDSDYLLFLNNDIEVISEGWLDALLAFGTRPEVGVVGAQLLYPDGTLQHYGVVMGMTGYAGHLLAGCAPEAKTFCGPTDMVRNCAAVTGACMLMRRKVFEEVGGFDERFIICGSDVAICLRVLSLGYRVVVTPHARLTHFESKTRGREIPRNDFQRSFEAYEPYLRNGDPYYNPQLSLKTPKASLRLEPEDMLAFARQFI